MTEQILHKAAHFLLESMDKAVDGELPTKIAKIVKFCSKGAAIAGVASGWIPGAGGTAAVVVSAGFVWTMYAQINSAIGLPLSQNIIKSLASGVATNIAASAIGSIALTTALSFIPGLGSFAASAIAGGTCYALTLASGFVYLKILTKLFQAGKDPTSMTAEDLKQTAQTVVEQEDIKSVMKESKESYKSAKASGEIP